MKTSAFLPPSGEIASTISLPPSTPTNRSPNSGVAGAGRSANAADTIAASSWLSGSAAGSIAISAFTGTQIVSQTPRKMLARTDTGLEGSSSLKLTGRLTGRL
jgi:hypothetical protein